MQQVGPLQPDLKCKEIYLLQLFAIIIWELDNNLYSSYQRDLFADSLHSERITGSISPKKNNILLLHIIKGAIYVNASAAQRFSLLS